MWTRLVRMSGHTEDQDGSSQRRMYIRGHGIKTTNVAIVLVPFTDPGLQHWLNISIFSVKKLVKNVHYFSLKNQVKTLKFLLHFLTCFKLFTLKTKKW
jgi:hypothetical protein